jgi:hypothetical protein
MKQLQKIKEYSWAITLILGILLFFKQCGVSSDLEKIQKNMKTITSNVDSLQKEQTSKTEIKQMMNEVMFDFLIYEDDFDKGKSSLSDIKSKIKPAADANSEK